MLGRQNSFIMRTVEDSHKAEERSLIEEHFIRSVCSSALIESFGNLNIFAFISSKKKKKKRACSALLSVCSFVFNTVDTENFK